MAQARIVVRNQALEDGQKLLKVTKLGSLSELFNILISRYGRHLESTWVLEAPNHQCTSSSGDSAQTESQQSFTDLDSETLKNNSGVRIQESESILGGFRPATD